MKLELSHRLPDAFRRERPQNPRLLLLAASTTESLLEIADADGSPANNGNWRTLTLLADGVTPMADGSRLVLDAQAAADVITEIQRRGVDIPIDRDHATIRRGQDGGDAPAFGWIDHKSVTYVPGIGLQGRVKWTAAGADYVHGGAYRYISPVFEYVVATGRARSLHSLALTNKPLTLNAPALRAASGGAKNERYCYA